MLANAKPLWHALPDGALKQQMLSAIAQAGRMETADLQGLWGGTPAGRPASPPDAPRPARRRPQRVSAGTATLLDRALWLLVQRSDLWAALDGDGHDILAGQAAPYDRFFGCIERNFHDHGPLGAAALLGELR